MLNFYHIARNTFRECLREPIFFILLVSALLLIGLFPSMSMFVFREQTKLVVDSSMATTMVFGLIAAVLCASHTVSREMQNGTVLLLMSKPVHRWSFIVAKVFGITVALAIFVFICNTATLISLRVAKDQFQLDFTALYIYAGVIAFCAICGSVRNYINNSSFASTAVIMLLIMMPIFAGILNFIPADGKYLPLNFMVIPALLLLFFAVWTMGTITVVFSTRLNMVANLTLTSLLFVMGLMSDYFLRGDSSSLAGRYICKIFYAILPNWQFFWLADALASRQAIPVEYIFYSAVYVLLYMSLCIVWAIALFQNRELGTETI